VLIVRDGWGENPNPEHDAFNAIKLAQTPVDDWLRREYPSTLIATSGEDVGLPQGTMGNSEVGHQNIGAGRVVDQEAVRITKACREGHLRQNQTLVGAIEAARDEQRYVHFMGICSDAGVHGLIEHLEALIRLCKDLDMPRVVLHLFTDGRDTGPYTGLGYVKHVQKFLDETGIGVIGSVMGRFWAMDRDNRWERVERAYQCITGINARRAVLPVMTCAAAAVEAFYHNPESPNMPGDEFITPTMIGSSLDDALVRRVNPGDTVIFYNYRGDRPRELVSAFVLPDFYESESVKPSPDSGKRGFNRHDLLEVRFVTLTAYSEALAPYVSVAFPKPPKMEDIGGAYLSRLGLTQFRCAETEKYPHVTFFFNDYRDEPFPGEHRSSPQSPRVSTYDEQPEMSAHQVRDAVLERLAADDCEDFILVNFANGDMVGHTGVLDAAVKACETVDACVGTIIDATLARNGRLIVTADHGNAEQMFDPESNAPHTAHTTYPVPFFVVGKGMNTRRLRQSGRLADVFPTVLDLMGLPKPQAMTGTSLLRPD